MEELKTLTVKEKEGVYILKEGRKIYAEISFNKNPDYKWVIFFKGGLALSGYKTSDDAIKRAQEKYNDVKNLINSFERV